MSENSGRKSPGPLDYAAVYGLVLLLLVGAYYALVIWRRAIPRLLFVINPEGSELGEFSNRALLQFATLLLGIFLFIGVLGSEAYLRDGITGRKNQLWPRFLRLAIPLIGFCVLGVITFRVALAMSL